MDSTTFRYLLGLAVHHSLETQLLDVVTAYLYGPLDAQLYIKPPPDFLSQSIPADSTHSFLGLRLQHALYGLKQAGRMWYSHLHSFLLSHGFQHDQSLPCIFILHNSTSFVIITVYVDDLNLVGTTHTCQHVVSLLTKRFEMKLLGKTSYWLVGCPPSKWKHSSSSNCLHSETSQALLHGQGFTSINTYDWTKQHQR